MIITNEKVNDEAMKQFFHHIPYPGNNISFAFKTANGRYKGCHGACHAAMFAINSWCPDKKVKYLSQLRHYDRNFSDSRVIQEREKAKRFWDALFDPDHSPWMKTFTGFEYVYDGDRVCAFAVDVDDKTNNQLLTNLAIASRFPYEHYNFFKNFDLLLEQGFSKKQALFLVQVSNVELTSILTYNLGHHGLDPMQISWNKFKESKPTLRDHLVSRGDPYTPNNVIWNDSDSAFLKYREHTSKVVSNNNDSLNRMRFKTVYLAIQNKSNNNAPVIPVLSKKDYMKVMKEILV